MRQRLAALAYQFHARFREARELWHTTGGVVLTFRQRQCLYWAAEGKSFGEISQIVGVMPRTVKFHIDNAKMKFGVRTAREAAIAFAISRFAGLDQPVFSGY